MADQPTHEELAKAYEACVGERKPKRKPNFEMRVLQEAALVSGVATTVAAMKGWQGNRGRTNQAAAFLKRAKKSDARRRIEKATRKKMRRRK